METAPTTETTPVESAPVETETDVAPVETAPTETAPVESGFESAPVLEIPLEKLQLSKDVPNFKEGADAKTGVVKGEELEGKYERTGTAPIVVFERLNGDLEVITGRHRLDLAKRSGEKTIPSQIVREADGFTVEDAKTFDAESNIRDEKGTVKDYAHYFRNKDISQADAESRGLVARKKGQQGWAIGKQASDEIYGLYRNGKITDDRAAAIARGAPNDADVQRAAFRSSQGMDALTLEIHTRRLAAYKAENTSDVSDGGGIQGDLFGEDDSAMQEIVAISKAAGELVKENKQKIAAVSGAVKRPEIAREMGVDINNPEQVKAAIQALEYENSRLISPTPEIEILNKIRRRAGLSEIVDESTTDSEVDVHHDDDTASLDLGFDAKKEGEAVSYGHKGKGASASSTASSTSTTAGTTVLTAEEKASRSYAVLRKLASAVFKARKAILSRKIYDGGRILPRGIKLDKTTNRLVGMCSIADIRRYISKAFELPISSGIRDGGKRMLGAYWNSLQAISMKSGHLNDIQSVAHELGHHLEMILFGYTLNGSKTDVEAELASYGREKFGDAYASSDLAREGFAELIADILNENPDVKTRCPIAYEVLRQALADNPVVSKVFNNIRQMIIINKDADAWAKLNANIRRKNDVERSPLVQKIQEFGEKALRALTDSLEGLDRLRKFLNEQRPGSGDRFWEHANNYRGGHLGQIDLCIKVHQVDIDGVVVGKSLLAIIKDNLKTAFDRENINAYLIARRCIEYYRANPKERTADCRKKFGIEYDVAVQVYNESTPGMRKCAEELDVYMRNNLKLLLDGKVISRKLYDKLIKNKGYVPMQRYMEAINESATSGSGKGFANVSSPIRSFFGSDREIIAGIDTIIEQTIQFREIAQKNRVALEVIQGISGGTATGNWATPARDKYNVTDVDLKKWAELVLTYKERTGEVEKTTGDVRRQAIEEIIAELEAQIEADADLSLILKIYEKEAKEDKANGIITALNGNGEKVAWQIHDKGLYFALANLDPIGAQFWSTLAGRFLSFPTRALRAGATSAVGFVFANLIRDTQAATVLSNNKYRPWQSFTKGFLPSLVGKIPAVKRRAMAMKMAKEFLEANGELYDEWVASGGSMATSIDNTKARAEVTADELLADGFFGAWFARFKHSKTSTAMDAMLLPFETLAKVSEEMPRLAEYRNAREAEIKRLMKENGFTRAEAEAWWKSEKGSYARIKAANHSKSVTLNFSRSGWLSYHLNMVIPFFNAGMQGLDRFRTDLNPCDWRKLVTALYHLNLDEAKESVNKDNSVKFAKLVAIAGIVSALSWFSLRDDDDDDDETKNAKDKIHDWRKRAYWNFQFGDTIITIPKSQELAPFCAVFEKMFNAVSGTKQDAGSDILGNIWHVLVPSFRPQVINMYYELESGYSSFTEAPLESQSLKALPKFVRANATTSDTARYLAQVFHNYGIEVSPITLDAGISLAFSTLGRDVVGWIADPVVRTFGGMPDKMAYDWKETAFTKRFFVNEFTPSVYVKKFHDMAADCNRIRALERHVADGRVYSRNGISDADAKKINWYNGDYDGHPRYWHIRKVQKAMADARTDMIKIANDTTLSPQEKREKTLLLRKFVDRCAKNAVEILKQK